MESLNVFLNNKLVGNLTRTRNGTKFQYDSGLQINLPLLSTSLPVKMASYNEGRTRDWFEGLLPEGKRLEDLSRIVGCDLYDYFKLLKNVGYECAGAIQIIPEDFTFKNNRSLQQITSDELHEIIINNQYFGNIDDEFWRISIGGFQDKICITIKDGKMFLPNKGAISTHILKPEMPSYSGLVESEAWATDIASNVTKGSKVETIKIKEIPVLRIERFDRDVVDGNLVRIHQEDFCQACGLNTSFKYANPREIKGTDPTYKNFTNILFSYSVDPLLQIQTLAKQMVINLCLGNYDAHAKNYSILHDKNSNVSMSPMYDVVPIAEVEPRTKYISIRINGKINPEDITRKDIEVEINTWGLSLQTSKHIVDECCELISEGMKRCCKIYPKASRKHKSATTNRLKKYGL